MMPDTIDIRNATKVIDKRTVLDDVTLTLERGGIYGFTGINGSGKTMFFRAVSGLIHLTSGSITVFGQRVGQDVDFPSKMGLSLEPIGFWEECTGLENLLLLASIRRAVGEGEARESLCRVGLDPDDTRPFSAFSTGMRRRLSIAQAIMEKPELLILDEPTNGLDISGIRMVEDIVAKEHGRGCTVLLTCHNEPMLEALFERHFPMSDGRLAGDGSNR